jgi:uncharacterized phage protein gp47/JayE
MTLLAGQSLFKNREQLTQELLDGFQSAIPDVHLGEDSVVRIISEVMATVIESVFLSLQIVNEDMFVDTANINALYRWGEQYGIYRKMGTRSTGTLRFQGTGGTVIPIGTEVAYDPLTGGDFLYFVTTSAGTLPNPGIPGPPTIADGGAAGVLAAGTYEYQVAFLTAAGETEPSADSNVITVAASHKMQLTAIPLGGTGTTGRRIYRQRDATGYHFVADILDNTTTTYLDNIAENLGGASPVPDSTAERITVNGQAEDAGLDYNVATSSITIPTTVPDGVTDVINTVPFTGGSDPETPEDYRVRVIDAIRNPGTGSPGDLKTWAEEVDGVETATVFTNDNMGTPTPGHVTVRITGPGGTVPGTDVIQAVYDALAVQDLANITIHVGTFTPVVTNVAVTITLQPNFVLADITPSVQTAISNYVNNLQVGETFRVNGVIAVTMPLPGVADVAVTSPATNQATGATSKRTAGTVTVS